MHVPPLSQQPLEVVGANEARVAVLLQQQPVHVVGGMVQCVPRAGPQPLGHSLGCRAVDVDLARRAGFQELSGGGKRLLVRFWW